MDNRIEEIIRRFEESWSETESFYRDLLENYEGFSFVEPILQLIQKMKDSGDSQNFRIGTSMHTLVISRSVKHGLSNDQKEIRIERINDLQDGFEYEVVMRQGDEQYRKYRVTDLSDERVMKLIKTLKGTLID